MAARRCRHRVSAYLNDVFASRIWCARAVIQSAHRLRTGRTLSRVSLNKWSPVLRWMKGIRRPIHKTLVSCAFSMYKFFFMQACWTRIFLMRTWQISWEVVSLQKSRAWKCEPGFFSRQLAEKCVHQRLQRTWTPWDIQACNQNRCDVNVIVCTWSGWWAAFKLLWKLLVSSYFFCVQFKPSTHRIRNQKFSIVVRSIMEMGADNR